MGRPVNACMICERALNPKTCAGVHMTTSWKPVPFDYAGKDSQGCFMIGRDCLKSKPEYQAVAFSWKEKFHEKEKANETG